MKILFADDDVALLEIIRHVLSEDGHDVSLASDGNQVLLLFARLKPDLVILDIRMPGLSGLEVLHEIRKIDRYVSVIILSMLTNMEYKVIAYQEHADYFLPKPFDLDVFQAYIRAIQKRRTAALLNPSDRAGSLVVK
ncbi:MAG: response regulator transcription factor [Elusimicrobia bacterium]|nr:response regulator transcription factor [Elusimicrobiota bacterium]